MLVVAWSAQQHQRLHKLDCSLYEVSSTAEFILAHCCITHKGKLTVCFEDPTRRLQMVPSVPCVVYKRGSGDCM